MAFDTQPAISTVLLDIGGVLIVDVWETVLLNSDDGLAHQLDVDPSVARREASRLWSRFATSATNESQYWAALSEVLGIEIPSTLVEAAINKLLVPDVETHALFRFLANIGLDVGIVSNNTTFWFERQNKILNIERFVAKDLIFLSHERGVEKSEGLYEIAATAVDPSQTLVVDNDRCNLAVASAIGFLTCEYSMYKPETGLLRSVQSSISSGER